MIKPIRIVAKNTYTEIIRDKILYGILVFAALLMGLSLALGQLSFQEQSKITIDFGFAAVQLSAVILAIFVGSTLVSREIEKKTIMTLLVRPISRAQFIIGKSLGLLCVIFVASIILVTVLTTTLLSLGLKLDLSFLVGLHGIFLEAGVLLGITIFFGSFASPMLSVAFSIGIFLIGHWLDSLKYFAESGDSPLLKAVEKIATSTVPNLEVLNWRSLYVYQEPIPFEHVGMGTFYSFCWFSFSIALASFILSRRDLG